MMKLRTDGASRVVNPASPFRIASIVGCALIVSLLYSPLAMGETKIQEVQVVTPGNPTQLSIWGEEFGPIDDVLNTPMILFGTESTQLDIPVDQGLCQLAPPPPLELPSDCVVVDLPPDAVPVSAGDYLLAMWVELPATECVSKPSSLPGFPFWPSWSVYDSRLPAAMQRFSHCCQVRYSFRCRSGLRMLADHGVPAKPEGPLATPLPRRPSATRVRWLFRAVDVTLRAQVAPKSAAACRRTTSGSDAPPQAATNNIARASRAVRPS